MFLGIIKLINMIVARNTNSQAHCKHLAYAPLSTLVTGWNIQGCLIFTARKHVSSSNKDQFVYFFEYVKKYTEIFKCI